MIDQIITWFNKAIPAPTNRQIDVQLGCHMEEIVEMLSEIKYNAAESEAEEWDAQEFLAYDSINLKTGRTTFKVRNQVELLDALCDQIVTAVGLGTLLGYDMQGALAEVIRSNNSKFENGEPVFDPNGKIFKGRFYTKPELEDFV